MDYLNSDVFSQLINSPGAAAAGAGTLGLAVGAMSSFASSNNSSKPNNGLETLNAIQNFQAQTNNPVNNTATATVNYTNDLKAINRSLETIASRIETTNTLLQKIIDIQIGKEPIDYQKTIRRNNRLSLLMAKTAIGRLTLTAMARAAGATGVQYEQVTKNAVNTGVTSHKEILLNQLISKLPGFGKFFSSIEIISQKVLNTKSPFTQETNLSITNVIPERLTIIGEILNDSYQKLDTINKQLFLINEFTLEYYKDMIAQNDNINKFFNQSEGYEVTKIQYLDTLQNIIKTNVFDFFKDVRGFFDYLSDFTNVNINNFYNVTFEHYKRTEDFQADLINEQRKANHQLELIASSVYNENKVNNNLVDIRDYIKNNVSKQQAKDQSTYKAPDRSAVDETKDTRKNRTYELITSKIETVLNKVLENKDSIQKNSNNEKYGSSQNIGTLINSIEEQKKDQQKGFFELQQVMNSNSKEDRKNAAKGNLALYKHFKETYAIEKRKDSRLAGLQKSAIDTLKNMIGLRSIMVSFINKLPQWGTSLLNSAVKIMMSVGLARMLFKIVTNLIYGENNLPKNGVIGFLGQFMTNSGALAALQTIKEFLTDKLKWIWDSSIMKSIRNTVWGEIGGWVDTLFSYLKDFGWWAVKKIVEYTTYYMVAKGAVNLIKTGTLFSNLKDLYHIIYFGSVKGDSNSGKGVWGLWVKAYNYMGRWFNFESERVIASFNYKTMFGNILMGLGKTLLFPYKTFFYNMPKAVFNYMLKPLWSKLIVPEFNNFITLYKSTYGSKFVINLLGKLVPSFVKNIFTRLLSTTILTSRINSRLSPQNIKILTTYASLVTNRMIQNSMTDLTTFLNSPEGQKNNIVARFNNYSKLQKFFINKMVQSLMVKRTGLLVSLRNGISSLIGSTISYVSDFINNHITSKISKIINNNPKVIKGVKVFGNILHGVASHLGFALRYAGSVINRLSNWIGQHYMKFFQDFSAKLKSMNQYMGAMIEVGVIAAMMIKRDYDSWVERVYGDNTRNTTLFERINQYIGEELIPKVMKWIGYIALTVVSIPLWWPVLKVYLTYQLAKNAAKFMVFIGKCLIDFVKKTFDFITSPSKIWQAAKSVIKGLVDGVVGWFKGLLEYIGLKSKEVTSPSSEDTKKALEDKRKEDQEKEEQGDKQNQQQQQHQTKNTNTLVDAIKNGFKDLGVLISNGFEYVKKIFNIFKPKVIGSAIGGIWDSILGIGEFFGLDSAKQLREQNREHARAQLGAIQQFVLDRYGTEFNENDFWVDAIGRKTGLMINEAKQDRFNQILEEATKEGLISVKHADGKDAYSSMSLYGQLESFLRSDYNKTVDERTVAIKNGIDNSAFKKEFTQLKGYIETHMPLRKEMQEHNKTYERIHELRTKGSLTNAEKKEYERLLKSYYPEFTYEELQKMHDDGWFGKNFDETNFRFNRELQMNYLHDRNMYSSFSGSAAKEERLKQAHATRSSAYRTLDSIDTTQDKRVRSAANISKILNKDSSAVIFDGMSGKSQALVTATKNIVGNLDLAKENGIDLNILENDLMDILNNLEVADNYGNSLGSRFQLDPIELGDLFNSLNAFGSQVIRNNISKIQKDPTKIRSMIGNTVNSISEILQGTYRTFNSSIEEAFAVNKNGKLDYSWFSSHQPKELLNDFIKSIINNKAIKIDEKVLKMIKPDFLYSQLVSTALNDIINNKNKQYKLIYQAIIDGNDSVFQKYLDNLIISIGNVGSELGKIYRSASDSIDGWNFESLNNSEDAQLKLGKILGWLDKNTNKKSEEKTSFLNLLKSDLIRQNLIEQGDVDAVIPNDPLNFGIISRLTTLPTISNSNTISGYNIQINKKLHELSLLNGNELVKKYSVTTGKNPGKRIKQGDQATPEGNWFIKSIEDSSSWTYDYQDGKGKVKAYGPWFLRLNAEGVGPDGKKWGGIGIHGTSRPEMIGKNDSNGCIRLLNSDITELKEKYAYKGMPVLIYDDILPVSALPINLSTNSSYPKDWTKYILKYSNEYGVDPELISAMIKNESNGNPRAVSYVGAKGLMQIMPKTGQEIANRLHVSNYDLFDPETSIKFGTYYIAEKIKNVRRNYPNATIIDALRAYNGGEGTLKKYINMNPYEIKKHNKQLGEYPGKVLQHYGSHNYVPSNTSLIPNLLKLRIEAMKQAGMKVTDPTSVLTIPFNYNSQDYQLGITDYMRFSNKAAKDNYGLMNPILRDRLAKYAEAYYQKYKKPIVITSTYRSYEQQKALWDNRKNNPYPVARPNPFNRHTLGAAVDLSVKSGSIDDNLLAKFRLKRPSPKGDAVHVEGVEWSFDQKPQPDLVLNQIGNYPKSIKAGVNAEELTRQLFTSTYGQQTNENPDPNISTQYNSENSNNNESQKGNTTFGQLMGKLFGFNPTEILQTFEKDLTSTLTSTAGIDIIRTFSNRIIGDQSEQSDGGTLASIGKYNYYDTSRYFNPNLGYLEVGDVDTNEIFTKTIDIINQQRFSMAEKIMAQSFFTNNKDKWIQFLNEKKYTLESKPFTDLLKEFQDYLKEKSKSKSQAITTTRNIITDHPQEWISFMAAKKYSAMNMSQEQLEKEFEEYLNKKSKSQTTVSYNPRNINPTNVVVPIVSESTKQAIKAQQEAEEQRKREQQVIETFLNEHKKEVDEYIAYVSDPRRGGSTFDIPSDRKKLYEGVQAYIAGFRKENKPTTLSILERSQIDSGSTWSEANKQLFIKDHLKDWNKFLEEKNYTLESKPFEQLVKEFQEYLKIAHQQYEQLEKIGENTLKTATSTTATKDAIKQAKKDNPPQGNGYTSVADLNRETNGSGKKPAQTKTQIQPPDGYASWGDYLLGKKKSGPTRLIETSLINDPTLMKSARFRRIKQEHDLGLGISKANLQWLKSGAKDRNLSEYEISLAAEKSNIYHNPNARGAKLDSGNFYLHNTLDPIQQIMAGKVLPVGGSRQLGKYIKINSAYTFGNQIFDGRKTTLGGIGDIEIAGINMNRVLGNDYRHGLHGGEYDQTGQTINTSWYKGDINPYGDNPVTRRQAGYVPDTLNTRFASTLTGQLNNDYNHPAWQAAFKRYQEQHGNDTPNIRVVTDIKKQLEKFSKTTAIPTKVSTKAVSDWTKEPGADVLKRYIKTHPKEWEAFLNKYSGAKNRSLSEIIYEFRKFNNTYDENRFKKEFSKTTAIPTKVSTSNTTETTTNITSISDRTTREAINRQNNTYLNIPSKQNVDNNLRQTIITSRNSQFTPSPYTVRDSIRSKNPILYEGMELGGFDQAMYKEVKRKLDTRQSLDPREEKWYKRFQERIENRKKFNITSYRQRPTSTKTSQESIRDRVEAEKNRTNSPSGPTTTPNTSATSTPSSVNANPTNNGNSSPFNVMRILNNAITSMGTNMGAVNGTPTHFGGIEDLQNIQNTIFENELGMGQVSGVAAARASKVAQQTTNQLSSEERELYIKWGRFMEVYLDDFNKRMDTLTETVKKQNQSNITVTNANSDNRANIVNTDINNSSTTSATSGGNFGNFSTFDLGQGALNLIY